MVSLRGARGSLEWKGKRLKYVANESAHARPAGRVLRGKDPETLQEHSARCQPGHLACSGRAEPGGHRLLFPIIEPLTKPAGPPCPSSAH